MDISKLSAQYKLAQLEILMHFCKRYADTIPTPQYLCRTIFEIYGPNWNSNMQMTFMKI